MTIKDTNGIAVDTDLVAEVFKCSKEEATELINKHYTPLDRHVLRAVSDVAGIVGRGITPEDRFQTAKYWVAKYSNTQYETGYKDGINRTKEDLRKKLDL